MRATLIASLTELESLDSAASRVLLEEVELLEVRADLVGEVSVEGLRDRFAGRLLYTLRSSAEGGNGDSDGRLRHAALQSAAADYDLVDLESDRDLTPEVLAAVRPEQRVLSWHGRAESLSSLLERWQAMATVEAGWLKLVATTVPGYEHIAAELFAAVGGGAPKTISFALGSSGLWTRLLSAQLGAPVVYGALTERVAAPGQPTVARLVADYGLPELVPAQVLFGVVGSPVVHSLSPRIHNGGYRDGKVSALYLPFEASTWESFWQQVAACTALARLSGLSVTTPYKESALAAAVERDAQADRIGACNTLVRVAVSPGSGSEAAPVPPDARASTGGRSWRAFTTDPDGVVGALEAWEVALAGRRTAVLGAGGAGRAAALGLKAKGARVEIVNRSVARGQNAARALGLSFVEWQRFDPRGYDVVVNATSVGRRPQDPPPVDASRLDDGAVVVEMVYGDQPTALEERAADRGCAVIGGREVLLQQARRQFSAMCGGSLDLEASRRRIGAPSPPNLKTDASSEGARA